MRDPARTRARCLALAALVLGTLALRVTPAGAGGNLQIRQPADPATIIPTLWDTRRLPIRWVLSDDGIPNSGIDLATVEVEIQAAFDAWEALPTSAAAFAYGGRVTARNAQQTGSFGIGIDGRNLVTFTDPDLVFPPGVLAVSLTTAFTGNTVVTAANADLDGDGTADLPEGTYPAGRIFDSDIAFNLPVGWAVSGAAGTHDVRAVALHEVGHLLGLCHSAIRHAVMWPFLPTDVLSVRLPTADDAAWVSQLYPSEPALSAGFGRIAGKVTNGANDLPVLGAHVYAVDPATQASVVGGYTGDDGTYVLPGLPPGDWLVAIEPLDGDPPGTEPFRVNAVVASTLDTNFPDEFRDADEGAVEADATAAMPVPVTAGTTAGGVDLVTNTLTLPGTTIALPAGFSLFAWPVAVPAGTTAFDVLAALGGPDEVAAVDRYDPRSGGFVRTEHRDGAPAGVDFPIRRGEGYAVHMRRERLVGFTGATDCPGLDLVRGLNLIGVPCRPPGYTAFALLQDLGTDLEVDRVTRFDPAANLYRVARYGTGGAPEGEDFAIAPGEGYLVVMRTPKGGVKLPAKGHDATPLIAGLSPGRGVPGTVVAILGEGFDPDPAKNLVSFNGVPAAAVVATTNTVTAVVPGPATTGPVRVTVGGKTSNGVDFVVEPAVVNPGGGANTTELVSGQTAEAGLGADGEQDRYTFTALAGSVVTVTATALSAGVPDLVLVLEDPFGAIATIDDNGGGGTNPRINNFVLNTTGTHTIVVTNVPGSGAGGYRLTLAIATRPAPTQLSILSGDVQTGEPGTVLADPLAIFATGPTGAPLAGIPVTVVATELEVEGQALPGPIEAGTVVLATNKSGIVTITTTLPDKSGIFEIQVSIPGAQPVKFQVASASGRVTRVTTHGDGQHGVVDTALAAPLEVVLSTSTNAPVAGAAVQFKVVSGGGTITPDTLQTSDAAGSVQATWKLGKLTSAPQIVAATVPGRTRPILFEAVPDAAAPAKLVADKTNFNRVTLGTTVLNAIFVRVLDGFGNPVPNATVHYETPPGLMAEPGIGPGGERFMDFKTNAKGLHVAAIGATIKAGTPGVCNELSSDVLPSIDEFGTHRRAPYDVIVSVPATTATEIYSVDVDMGPRLTIAEGANVDGAIGAVKPLEFRLHRIERHDVGFDFDFRPDPFGCYEEANVLNAEVHVSAHREDGNDEDTVGLKRTRVIDNNRTTGTGGLVAFDLVLGDVAGDIVVIGTVAKLRVVFLHAKNNFADFDDPHQLTGGLPAKVKGPRVVVELTDSGTGTDLRAVVLKLNGATFFDGTAPPAQFPVFPDRLQVLIGDREVKTLTQSLLESGAFDRVRFHYFPSLGKLQANNTVEVSAPKDRAGNQGAAAPPTAFTWP